MSDDRSMDFTPISLPTRVIIHADTKTADLSTERSTGPTKYDYTDGGSRVAFTMQAGQDAANDRAWRLREASYDGSLQQLQSKTTPTLSYKLVSTFGGTENAGMTNGNGGLSNGTNGLT